MHSNERVFDEGLCHLVVHRGPDEPSLDGCWQQVQDFIESGHMSALLDLVGNSQNPDIYLFSYFFDLLKWVGVISELLVHSSFFLEGRAAQHLEMGGGDEGLERERERVCVRACVCVCVCVYARAHVCVCV